MNKIFVIAITLFLFLLPFFWFKPGEMDLGGDGSRLYFYDPYAYLSNYAFYSVSPSSLGAENIGFFMVPFVVFLIGLKSILSSPTILIAFFHGLNFSIAFLACYGILRNLFFYENKKMDNIHQLAAIVVGLFYVFSPIGLYGWDKVLVTHSQFFLNPLLFFLLLRYFITTKTIYLAVSLLVSFIFSPNFSFAAAPAFFAFFPLSFLFLCSYRLLILKKPLIWKHILITSVTFICLQLFHIVPQVVSMFSPGSVLNTGIFSEVGKLDRGLNYFNSVAPSVKVSLNVMSLPQSIVLSVFHYLFIIFPIIIVAGLIFNRSKTVLLSAMGFLIALFFASANITGIGFSFYQSLFNLPGFAMFRNFYGQWHHVLLFFYTIILGQTLAIVFLRIKPYYRHGIFLSILIILFITALPLINGSLVNKNLWDSPLKIFMRIDPQYEGALNYMRALPGEGKVLTLPLTDPGYQIIAGINNGAYQGPSTISYLAGKKDFAGSTELGPFKQEFQDAITRGDFKKIEEILTKLGIRYIFYNSDSKIYEKGFPAFPYEYVRDYMPNDQKGYLTFLTKLDLKKKKQYGQYIIYERNIQRVLPSIYSSQSNIYTNVSSDIIASIRDVNEVSNRISILPSDLPIESYKDAINTVLLGVDTTTAYDQFLQQRKSAAFPSAFISRKLDSNEYPLIVWKEKSHLKSLESLPDEYIDFAVFYADKRLNELEVLGKDLQILGNIESIAGMDQTWQEPGLIDRKHVYNSWEVTLLRYQRHMNDLISRLDNKNVMSNSAITNKRYIQKILKFHQDKMNNSIFKNVSTLKDKKYLLYLDQEIFNNLENKLIIQLPDPSSFDFELKPPKDDSYNILIQRKDLDYLQEWTMQIDDKKISSVDSQALPLIKFENLNLEKEKVRKIKIQIPIYTNLLDPTTWKSSDEYGVDDSSLSYLMNDSATIQAKGIYHQILPWEQESHYLLRLEYNTYGSYFSLNIDEDPDVFVEGKLSLYEHVLHSNGWKSIDAVFQVSPGSKKGFLQISKLSTEVTRLIESDKKDVKRVDIRNISLVKIPRPKIFLEKSVKPISQEMPNITFKKINSTKYEVTVKAKQPYTLILLNEANARWELFKKSGHVIEGSIAETYFDKSITELDSNKTIVDLNAFETLGKESLVKDTHMKVNNFANAWYIDPKALDKSDTQTFILEMTTQRYFYIGLVISLITFVGLVIYLLYRLVRHEK
jgi:hypothetical protein